MEIRHKLVSELTGVEYQACKRANYGSGGYMEQELYNCRNNGAPGRAVLLWDGPNDKTSSLIGWALLTPVKEYGEIAVTSWVMKRSKYTAQLWVKTKYRQQGHGKTLMKEVKRLDPRPHVMPHNVASRELFSAFEVQVMNIDKHWIRKKPKVA